MSDSWYTSAVADDERADVTYSSSAISQLMTYGSYDEGSGGSHDVGMATIASLTGQLQSLQDQIASLESQLAIAGTLNATLAGQVGSLERDLSSAQVANSSLLVQKAELQAQNLDLQSSRDQWYVAYHDLSADTTTDTRPGTLFDTLERKTYDVIDDKTTLLVATIFGIAGALATQSILGRPGLKSGVTGGMVGVIGGVVVAELAESAWADWKDDLPWWNPMGWF